MRARGWRSRGGQSWGGGAGTLRKPGDEAQTPRKPMDAIGELRFVPAANLNLLGGTNFKEGVQPGSPATSQSAAPKNTPPAADGDPKFSNETAPVCFSAKGASAPGLAREVRSGGAKVKLINPSPPPPGRRESGSGRVRPGVGATPVPKAPEAGRGRESLGVGAAGAASATRTSSRQAFALSPSGEEARGGQASPGVAASQRLPSPQKASISRGGAGQGARSGRGKVRLIDVSPPRRASSCPPGSPEAGCYEGHPGAGAAREPSAVRDAPESNGMRQLSSVVVHDATMPGKSPSQQCWKHPRYVGNTSEGSP